MMEIEKDRRRFLVKFKGVEFYINVDTIIKPIEDYFVEIKAEPGVVKMLMKRRISSYILLMSWA